jgi:hypothetical protein
MPARNGAERWTNGGFGCEMTAVISIDYSNKSEENDEAHD